MSSPQVPDCNVQLVSACNENVNSSCRHQSSLAEPKADNVTVESRLAAPKTQANENVGGQKASCGPASFSDLAKANRVIDGIKQTTATTVNDSLSYRDMSVVISSDDDEDEDYKTTVSSVAHLCTYLT
jgi:hypothetical protein